MKRFSLTIITCLAVSICATMNANAQTHLNNEQILKSLSGLPTAKGNINYQLLRQQAMERIKAENSEMAVNRKPLVAELSQLPNLNVEILFDFDSAWINPKSYVTIGRMADALHHPILLGNRFLIVGHTDAKGKREYNLDLSQRRADAIRTALINTFSVEPNRLIAVGLGEEQLRESAHPDAAINRRVQLINIGS